MSSRKIVYVETGIVLLGQVLCTAIMLAVFALLHKLDQSVVLGAAAGSFLAVAYFFFMALTTCLAADKAEKQDVKGGQNLVRISYILRFGLLFLFLFVCVKSGYCNLYALLIPQLFTRPVLTIAEFFRKSGEKKA